MGEGAGTGEGAGDGTGTGTGEGTGTGAWTGLGADPCKIGIEFGKCERFKHTNLKRNCKLRL